MTNFFSGFSMPVPDADFIPNLKDFKPRTITGVNTTGLITLIYKEVGRFLNVYSQTIVAPVITTLLYYAIFALAFGGLEMKIGDMPYLAFLAPGLMIMTMVQNAFANTSSSIVIAKVQGNIVDVLMPPISPTELFAGYVLGGILRAACVGVVCALVLAVVTGLGVHNIGAVLLFGFLGSAMMSSLGLAAGLWSQKFDHIAAVTNFIVTPMTFLSGTFYSVEQLPPMWANIAHYNPFFYMIDGFRFGFTGHADGNLLVGGVLLALINALLGFIVWKMVKTGYNIKS
jgi:ABC-2 type transport system permease protein